MNDPRIILETDRLILREFRPDDGDAMMDVFGDEEVMRFGSGVQSRAWASEWIERRQATYERADGVALWAVVEQDADEPIGYCGLTRFPDINGRPEIEVGYRLARIHWGKGYATESAMAVRDYAFDSLRLERLIALIDPDNVRSIRVAEKLGMRHESDVMLPGYSHADRVYVVESR